MANLPYVQLLDTSTQIIATADTPQLVEIDTIDDKNEFDMTDSVITYNKEGAARKFAYMICPQVGRDVDCETEVPNFRIWMQKRANDTLEFEDVPNTNVLLNVNRHRMTKDVIPLTGLVTLEEGNQIRFMMASNVDDLVKLEHISMTGEPNIPSIIISVFNIGLEKDEI